MHMHLKSKLLHIVYFIHHYFFVNYNFEKSVEMLEKDPTSLLSDNNFYYDRNHEQQLNIIVTCRFK